MQIGKKKDKKAGESWGDWRHGKGPAATQPVSVPARQTPVPMVQPAASPAPQPRPDLPATAAAQQQVPQPASGNTTVSINIHLPKIDLSRLEKFIKPLRAALAWLRELWHHGLTWFKSDRSHAVIAASVAGFIVVAVVALPLLLSRNGPSGGSSTNVSAGGTVSLVQPNFAVVVPKSKPSVAKTDGTKSTFDTTHDSYSFSDSMQNYGFVVSEQPVPSKFSSGQDAVNKIAPTVVGGSSQQRITTNYGTAYVITNSKNSTQTVVASVKKVLIFIQVSHIFNAEDWVNYLNSLK